MSVVITALIEGPTPPNVTEWRPNRARLRTEVWREVVVLAQRFGWYGDESPRQLTAPDAQRLAIALRSALPDIPDDPLPGSAVETTVLDPFRGHLRSTLDVIIFLCDTGAIDIALGEPFGDELSGGE